MIPRHLSYAAVFGGTQEFLIKIKTKWKYYGIIKIATFLNIDAASHTSCSSCCNELSVLLYLLHRTVLVSASCLFIVPMIAVILKCEVPVVLSVVPVQIGSGFWKFCWLCLIFASLLLGDPFGQYNILFCNLIISKWT